MSRWLSIQQRVLELEQQHGSLRAAARAIGMNAPYLLRLANGAKVHPSDDTLRKLGLQYKATLYERIAS